MTELWSSVYRAEWQSTLDGQWFAGSEWSAEVADAIGAQQRWRKLGHNTRVREEVQNLLAEGDER